MTSFDASRECAIADLVEEGLHAGGAVRFRALGTSMIPAIWPGDRLTVRRPEAGYPQVGDIALTLTDGRLRAHRVVRCLTLEGVRVVITRGDHLTVDDPAAEDTAILGVVIERNGRPLTSANRVLSGAFDWWSRLIRHEWFLAPILRLRTLQRQVQRA